MRKREADPIEVERRALVEQREALAALQRQLGERVRAVQEREVELRDAIGRAHIDGRGHQDAPVAQNGRTVLPPAQRDDIRADELEVRARLLDQRERALEERERLAVGTAALRPPNPDADTDENALAAAQRIAELETAERALSRELAAMVERERALQAELDEHRAAAAARAALPISQEELDAAKAVELETRIAELRAAERAFERTRDELTARSEAVAARERLVGDRERELSDREDGWGNPDLHELESRLRRLEQQKPAGAPTGFGAGVRKLEQQGKRSPKPS